MSEENSSRAEAARVCFLQLLATADILRGKLGGKALLYFVMSGFGMNVIMEMWRGDVTYVEDEDGGRIIVYGYYLIMPARQDEMGDEDVLLVVKPVGHFAGPIWIEAAEEKDIETQIVNKDIAAQIVSKVKTIAGVPVNIRKVETERIETQIGMMRGEPEHYVGKIYLGGHSYEGKL